jgi:hypothetical protein
MEALAAIILASGVEMAPFEYDRAPEKAVLIRHVPLAEVDRVCRWAHPELASMAEDIRGCANTDGPICLVILPYPGQVADPARYAALARHELAHCNGWRHE